MEILKAKQMQEKAERLKQAAEFKEQDWMKVNESVSWDRLDEGQSVGSGGDGDASDGEDADDFIDEFYCVACEKAFKSEKQYAF